MSKIPTYLLMRIQEEVLDIKHLIMESVDYIKMHLTSFDTASIRKFQMPPEQEIKYGLRKYIIVAT